MPGVARVNGQDYALCPEHTCKNCARCAHKVQGPATVGSPDVYCEGAKVVRKDDTGVHDSATCCGDNRWKATGGSGTVYVNGKPIFRIDDPTRHDEKDDGTMKTGSTKVIAG
jgi:hypothetical protein